MTRMTKKIHLALVGTALTLHGCGQKQAPAPPMPLRAQDGDWGGPRHEAPPPVIVKGALLGTTNLIVQNFGAQALAPGGLPLGTVTQAVCAAGLAEANAFPTVVFADNPEEWQGGAGVVADHQGGQQGTRHTTTTRHYHGGPGFIIITGGGGGYRSGPPVGGSRPTTTTGRPSGTSSMPGSSGSSVTSRGGFGSTGGSISGSSSS